VAEKRRTEASRILDRLEIRHGPAPALRRRLEPIVVRILESGMSREEQRGMLDLVTEAYTNHMRVWASIERLRDRLRNRLNELYGRFLGIEPPRVG